MSASGAATVPATRALLQGLVDFAGLFPPAGWPLERAVAAYAEYRGGPAAWILNRFVVPARRLPELERALEALDPALQGADAWPLTVIAGEHLAVDVGLARAFDDRLGPAPARVESVECVVRTPREVEQARALVPARLGLVLELPLDADVPTLARAARRAGAVAKVRAGGVRPGDIPPATSVLAFLMACARERVPFKATAGLHHPLRGPAPLTYEPGSERAVMHGFLNVALAAVALWQGGPADAALALLEEQDPGAFTTGDEAIAWRGRRFEAAAIAAARRELVTSVGSCSFTEPVAEFRHLATAHGGAS